MNKRAETGIGTLIIFIAMLIVASITANVLIQTATSLQSKALLTGEQTKEAISTYAQVMAITASDGRDNTLEDFTYQIKLAPGSSDMRLDSALLEFSLSDTSVDLVYFDGDCEYNQTHGYYTNETAKNGTFTLDYVKTVSNHKDGYLLSGEIVELCFRAPVSVGEDEDIEIRFVPRVGIPVSTEFRSPNVITRTYERLFP
ncbi:MAG: archaellin/type IV pilin N-terminal domain-containing protein [Candidatus Woesearchaeota archaeon]